MLLLQPGSSREQTWRWGLVFKSFLGKRVANQHSCKEGREVDQAEAEVKLRADSMAPLAKVGELKMK